MRIKLNNVFMLICALQCFGCGSAGSNGTNISIPIGEVIPSSNYVTDRRVIAPTYGTYPAKGETRTDPVSGAKITRRSNYTDLIGDYANNTASQSLIVYSRYSPINTSNEFVLVHGSNSTSCWVYRTNNNTVATILRFDPSNTNSSTSRSIGEINEIRWDYSGNHPYRLYFVGRSIAGAGMKFYHTDIDPVSGVQSAPVLIRDFTADFPVTGIYPAGGYSGAAIMNDVEGDSSNDSRYWAWQVMNITLGAGYQPYAFIVYDSQTNTIVGRAQRDCAGIAAPCMTLNTPATALPYLSRPNMVEISPLGTRTILHYGRTYTGKRIEDTGTIADGPHACQKDMTDCIRIGADETHSGWAWGAGGEELFVSQNNRNDYIEAVDISTSTTANCTVISGNNYTCGTKVMAYTDLDMNNWTLGMHFGKVYDQSKRGWLFMNTYDSNYATWGKNQNLFLEIKSYNSIPAPKIWRINPSYNVYYDYRSEGSGALSVDGKSLWSTANWGYIDGRAEVFSVGLPDDWYQHLIQPQLQ